MATKPQSEFGAEPYLPRRLTWSALERAADRCEGCPLYKHATQAVFGSGPADAKLMLIGEQPGDQEDRAGEPFVGPAGRLLDEVLHEVGLDRQSIYVTNAVKHFKWKPSGARRLHAKPSSREIQACRPWLEAEIGLLQPQIIVCLGATAAAAILGSAFRITKQRGEMVETPFARWTTATYHPSALLRVPRAEQRKSMREQFTEDLKAIAELSDKLTAQR